MPEQISFLRRLLTLRPIVPVIRLEGHIESGGRSGLGTPRALNINNTSRLLDRAFNVGWAQAIALVINSPGGSAAQSHLIAQRIIKLGQEKKKPVFAFVEDAAASGGYILALGAQEIYCDPFSIVGSIGVIHSSFGFTEAIKRLGIERRLETAGKNKSLLDPFKEETKEDKKRLRDLLDSIHKQFKSFVKERRGDKLKQPDEVLFEGDFWLAEKAVDFGLVDGIGDIRTVLRSKFGDDVMLPLISRPPSFLMPFDVGAAALSSLSDGLRTSQHWEKLGL